MSPTVARHWLPPVGLAGGELRDTRHVCGLFEGPERAYRTLLPFIADGLEHGERALHIVDPAARSSHLDRLAGAGIDVDRALRAGQLEVATWDRTYLHNGRFEVARMVGYIVEALVKGREQGFPTTRVVGYMGWAVPDVVGGADLVAYESQVDVALRGMPDPVICVYDPELHRAGLLVRILDAHPLGIVEGELRTASGRLLQPRDRILEAASELFPRRGIGASGVDTLIQVAGVAKATFYRHFPSKDDLVVAWLLDERSRWFDRVKRQAEESAGSPDDLIPALFDAVVEWLKAGDYRGCPYLNTAVEIVGPADPARRVVRDYLLEIEAHLRQMLLSQGHPAAEALAAELQTLLAGGIALSVAHRSPEPALAARDAALRLLREAASHH
jgi:AcrR family transcriptional regulator